MLKTILVHLRGKGGDSAVLSAALEVARPSAAHLEALYIQPSVSDLISRAVASEIEGNMTRIGEYIDSLKRQADKDLREVTQTFVEFCALEGIARVESPPALECLSAALSEAVGDELDILIRRSRCHDLIVLKGGTEENGGLGLQDVGQVITNVGRPILLAPNAQVRRIRTVAVAWKDAPEAARAVTAAMPLISKAEKVFVFNVSEGDENGTDCESVIVQLRWHGLNAEAHHIEPGERNAADSLLEMARAAEADLLVMGAYGRSRMSELIFGGFTQRVLADASLPVLLFH